MKDNESESISNAKVIGFIGLNVSDIILYLSRIACHLNQKIIIVDNSKNDHSPLKLSVSSPDLSMLMTQYRGIDFVQRMSISDISKDYELIIIYFSFSILSEFLKDHNQKKSSEKIPQNLSNDISKKLKNDIYKDFKKYKSNDLQDNLPIESSIKSTEYSLEEDIERCDELILTTDLEIYTHVRLTEYFTKSIRKESLSKINKSILIKDIISCKITPYYIKNELMNKIQGIKSCHEVDYDERDYSYKLSSQYDTVFRFPNLSQPLKEFLFYVFLQMGFEIKQIQKAYKLAKRGE